MTLKAMYNNIAGHYLQIDLAPSAIAINVR